jgi:hypothetical protein
MLAMHLDKMYNDIHYFFIKIETPTEIDISVYEVAEENIIDGKVSKTVHAKLQEEYGGIFSINMAIT